MAPLKMLLPYFAIATAPRFFFAFFLKLANKKEMFTKSTDIFHVKRDFEATKNPTLKGRIRVHQQKLQGEAKKLGERECSLDFLLLRVVTPFDDPCFDWKVGLVFLGKKPFKK